MAAFFAELSLVMVLVLLISFVMNKIKQPLLIGYIFTGILASPLFFDILSSNEGYETFSHIGISLLLFIVGLHLNLKLIKEVGLISLITGIGQVIFTSFIGFFIATIFGYGIVASFLIAIALTFSSTIIIVKLLSDKKDLETLYGKISMGFLIVQDLIAVVILMVLSAFLNPSSSSDITGLLLQTTFLAIVSVLVTFLLSRYVLPKLLEQIAKSTELLFVFIITWCFGIASLFVYLGFSLEIGALLAGVALASSPYQFEISARIRPLRDFFIVMFFILLGSHMIPSDISYEGLDFSGKLEVLSDTFGPIIVPATLFSLFVLIGNPLIVLILMSLLGYSTRTGFLAGLTVAQISEFSLILAMLGMDAGFLNAEEVSMITLVGIITITASTYMILNGNRIYEWMKPVLVKFERKRTKDSKKGIQGKNHEILVFGYDRIGFSLLKTIDKLGKPYLVVDYNPAIVKSLKEKGISVVYGDAGNIEFISEFDLKDVKLFISTIPDYEINLLLLENLRDSNSSSLVILTANDIDHALELYKNGADYVILPHFLGGEYVSTLIENYHEDYGDFFKEKLKHLNELKERKKHGLEHPKYEN